MLITKTHSCYDPSIDGYLVESVMLAFLEKRVLLLQG